MTARLLDLIHDRRKRSVYERPPPPKAPIRMTLNGRPYQEDSPEMTALKLELRGLESERRAVDEKIRDVNRRINRLIREE